MGGKISCRNRLQTSMWFVLSLNLMVAMFIKYDNLIFYVCRYSSLWIWAAIIGYLLERTFARRGYGFMTCWLAFATTKHICINSSLFKSSSLNSFKMLDSRTSNPSKVRIDKDVPQQEPGNGDCGVFMLMFTMYLMFGLKLDFDGSHEHYFRKKIVVDIFTGDIAL